ncbi:metalloregulator ArsR/SmtB family transcription factor [Alteromonas gilva]|uniref:Metalloregulator ArsR/SmtB family transcription factor n=1 Tax=Alteromonas gilva TaxID=2987522 RepID=A0ABT5KZT4_9ALTE|nr:metalloregulator ArsR/SmtB family transcription factor [Alteromonas gilva]MDC8830281.1 metalloregulator ArsR/SmtB family transcription factor [Alteromonas gilva]
MDPCQFFKCLADDTRLQSLLLIALEGETCVCDLMFALQQDQPKISRHLAALRKCQIVSDTRRGKWVFYDLSPTLPDWAKDVINNTARTNPAYLQDALKRLRAERTDSTNCC